MVGTFAWDLIVGPEGDLRFDGPGGLIHAVAALRALAPRGSQVVPISRVGPGIRRRIQATLDCLAGLDFSRIDTPEGPEGSGYTVQLRYRDAAERSEQARNLPAIFTEEELVARVRDTDALLVNFISGEDLAPDALPALRKAVTGPMLIDFHSLTLDRDAEGRRRRRASLPGWSQWIAGVEVVQVNAAEAMVLLGRGGQAGGVEDFAGLGQEVCHAGAGGLIVTCGEDGALWFDPGMSRIPAIPPSRVVDPTGCGDVHGAALLAGMLRGLSIPEAARLAAAAAGAQAGISGWPAELPGFAHLVARAGLRP